MTKAASDVESIEAKDLCDLPMAGESPLIVDLDGTLTPTDTLVESVLQLAKQSPLNLLRMIAWVLRGKAAFKSEVGTHAHIDPAVLPYRDAVLDYLRGEKQKGRKIILATAAHRSIAEPVSAHLGLFDCVLSSQGDRNLKGAEKLVAIRQQVGEDFIYAGDSRADIPIWKASRGAVLVGVSPFVAESVRRGTHVEEEFPRERVTIGSWFGAMRVHQWLKNLLLFVPLLTAFSFSQPVKLVAMTLAFLAFSLAASANYILNDLWDLDTDRDHPNKRKRPIASGRITIVQAMAASSLLLPISLLLAFVVSPSFLLVLLLYLAMSLAYSCKLKEYVLIDVIMLSVLYTVRIVAGSEAIAVTTSSWLLAFSVFIFLSLALVKRCTELVLLESRGKTETRGRDYRVSDLAVLRPMGIASAFSAIVVFGLFISSDDTQSRYATPEMLWLVALGLIYWLGRVWIKSSRGEMHDDPVVYAITDRGSRMVMVATVAVVLLARFVQWNIGA
jgi:4-hydroxybenzoate polyprenyltransferase/phosphoserine phosphatase